MPVLVNHDHKFIFIHVTKTGGTSVWSKIMEEYPETQIISRGGRLILMKNLAIDKENSSGITQHSSIVPHLAPSRIRRILKPEVYDNYFKFGFVRNPYEWIASLFLYRRRTLGGRIPRKHLIRGFNNYVTSQFVKHKERTQKHWVPNPPLSKTSFVGLFENLQSDFDLITSYIGIKSMKLPRLNGSSKTKYLTDNVYLDKNILDHVTKMLAKDINLYQTLSGKKAIDDIRTS